MIVIKPGGLRRYDVFLRGGRERVDTAFAVWALWNGGPGIVGYYPPDVRGHLYLDPCGTRVAAAFRIGRVSVREAA